MQINESKNKNKQLETANPKSKIEVEDLTQLQYDEESQKLKESMQTTLKNHIEQFEQMKKDYEKCEKELLPEDDKQIKKVLTKLESRIKNLKNILKEMTEEKEKTDQALEKQYKEFKEQVEELKALMPKEAHVPLSYNPPQESKLLSSIVVGAITALVASGATFGILYGTTILQDSVLQAYEAAIISAISFSALILGTAAAGIYHTYGK